VNKITFGNLSVTAKNKELLDYIELVSSAILEHQKPRKTVSATYQFIDTGLGYLDGGPLSLCFYGRIVKDTTIVREQVMQAGKLVSNRLVVPSSPSAFFVLNISDHRVSLLAETQGAPSISTFGNTLRHYVKNLHKEFIRSLYESQRESNPDILLKDLYEDFPRPIIDIAPIADKIAIDVFIKRFREIKQVTVNVIRRNQDFEPGELFDELAEDVAPLGPVSTKLIINGPKEGLNSAQTSTFIKNVVSHGYEDTMIKGKDQAGNDLSGTNEDYSLIRVVRDLPTDVLARAVEIHKQYIDAKANEQIIVATRDVSEVARRLNQIKARDE
jgi:hypothetical protein